MSNAYTFCVVACLADHAHYAERFSRIPLRGPAFHVTFDSSIDLAVMKQDEAMGGEQELIKEQTTVAGQSRSRCSPSFSRSSRSIVHRTPNDVSSGRCRICRRQKGMDVAGRLKNTTDLSSVRRKTPHA
jgi:hypothetical protein